MAKTVYLSLSHMSIEQMRSKATTLRKGRSATPPNAAVLDYIADVLVAAGPAERTRLATYRKDMDRWMDEIVRLGERYGFRPSVPVNTVRAFWAVQK